MPRAAGTRRTQKPRMRISHTRPAVVAGIRRAARSSTTGLGASSLPHSLDTAPTRHCIS